jgi:hypothetical protein
MSPAEQHKWQKQTETALAESIKNKITETLQESGHTIKSANEYLKEHAIFIYNSIELAILDLELTENPLSLQLVAEDYANTILDRKPPSSNAPRHQSQPNLKSNILRFV